MSNRYGQDSPWLLNRNNNFVMPMGVGGVPLSKLVYEAKHGIIVQKDRGRPKISITANRVFTDGITAEFDDMVLTLQHKKNGNGNRAAEEKMRVEEKVKTCWQILNETLEIASMCNNDYFKTLGVLQSASMPADPSDDIDRGK